MNSSLGCTQICLVVKADAILLRNLLRGGMGGGGVCLLVLVEGLSRLAGGVGGSW